MRQITSVSDLKDSISELEFNRAVHRRMLKDSFNSTMDSLKPGNVFKNVTEALVNPSLLANILPAVVGMGTGYVSKLVAGKITSGLTRGKKLRRILISVAMFGITKALVKNPEVSKMFGQKVMNTVFNR
jgi:hypothetical protein